jgi:hypothetical protein
VEEKDADIHGEHDEEGNDEDPLDLVESERGKLVGDPFEKVDKTGDPDEEENAFVGSEKRKHTGDRAEHEDAGGHDIEPWRAEKIEPEVKDEEEEADSREDLDGAFDQVDDVGPGNGVHGGRLKGDRGLSIVE